MAEPFNAAFQRTDAREPDLQTQVDDLRGALRDWRRNREYSESTQKRLEQITLQCAQLVDSWQQIQRRGGMAGIERSSGQRLLSGTGERIRALERAIESEWEAIPSGTDDPARRITEQTASLVESCVTATNLALRGFEKAESRVVALEQEIQAGLTQLSRDLQQVLSEIRSIREGPAAPAAPFPLEGVMRIHQELREGDGSTPPPSAASESTRPLLALPPAAETAALTARMDTLERTVERVADEQPARRRWWPALAAGLVLTAIAFTIGWVWLQRRIDTRLADAAQQVAAAERQRDAVVADTRQQAAQQVADAQKSAAQAQIVGTVMAAPDLVRYWLTGLGESRAYAHVLISRSRGLVFSASLMQPPGAGQRYQLWLLTRGGPVSAGLVTPDRQGRITFVTEGALILPGRLMGAFVTREPETGSVTPSADRVLVGVD